MEKGDIVLHKTGNGPLMTVSDIKDEFYICKYWSKTQNMFVIDDFRKYELMPYKSPDQDSSKNVIRPTSLWD